MPNLNVGLFSAVAVCALLNIGAAGAVTTTTATSCDQTSATPGKGFYIIGVGAPYSSTLYSYSTLPAANTVITGCTAGTYYKMTPTPAVSDSTSGLYGTLGVVYTCTSCATGYELQTVSGTFLYGSTSYQMICPTLKFSDSSVVIQKCVEKEVICTTSNCVSDTTWTSHSTGYFKRTVRSCPSAYEECVESVEYTCAYDYYGMTSSSAASGCHQCPQYRVTYTNPETGSPVATMYDTTTNMLGAPSVEYCYVSSDEFVDASGTWTLDNKCYYDLGNCSSWTAVCNSTSGTTLAVVDGTKSNTGGVYCWCNVNGKSYMPTGTAMGTAAACSASCKGYCNTTMVGHSANGWTPMVSVEDLGC